MRAVHLTRAARGVRLARGKRAVTYVHLLFARHQIIFAEGLASESFYPGPQALRMMAPSATGLFRCLPRLATEAAFHDHRMVERHYGPTARPVAAPQEVGGLLTSRRGLVEAGLCRPAPVAAVPP